MITMSFTDNTGTTHASSYWKIDSFQFQDMPGTGNTETSVVMKGYNNVSSYGNADQPIAEQSFQMPVGPVQTTPTVGQALTGIYNYCIASLPFFATGTDDGLVI